MARFLRTLVLLIATFASLVRAYQTPRLLRDPASFYGSNLVQRNGVQSEPQAFKYQWAEEYYEVPLDHFAFADNHNFKLRYLINTTHFVPNGPIFFYTGNEGKIEGFAENTGFMWDIAEEFHAAVVFAEHRFYGKSQPFGNESYSSVKNLGYLSSEQALGDFAQLITYLKQEKLVQAKLSPVIAFGGSYGGMLTAWMRVKYPHIIDGGIAASAPVFWFRNANIPEGIFDKIVTRTFKLSGCYLKSVSASFDAIVNLAKTEKGRAFLNQAFHLKSESQLQSHSDGPLLVGALQGIMETLAMVDYPYPANFLAPLPAWPIKEVCKAFTSKDKKSDQEYAKAAYHIANVFYNSTGELSDLCLIKHCADSFSALGDPLGWPWQSCTEMVMPICSEGAPNDVFPETCPFTDANAQAYCNATFGHIGYNPQVFRPQWAIDNYGASFPTASNIVFSNGYLDPWSGGGWDLKPATKGSLVSLIVEDGAHHLDLRGADPADTKSVLEVRRLEKLHIARWIKEANERHHQEKKKLKQRLAFSKS